MKNIRKKLGPDPIRMARRRYNSSGPHFSRSVSSVAPTAPPPQRDNRIVRSAMKCNYKFKFHKTGECFSIPFQGSFSRAPPVREQRISGSRRVRVDIRTRRRRDSIFFLFFFFFMMLFLGDYYVHRRTGTVSV